MPGCELTWGWTYNGACRNRSLRLAGQSMSWFQCSGSFSFRLSVAHRHIVYRFIKLCCWVDAKAVGAAAVCLAV